MEKRELIGKEFVTVESPPLSPDFFILFCFGKNKPIGPSTELVNPEDIVSLAD